FGSGIKVPLMFAYTYTDARELAAGFASTTAGDPRDVGWQPGVASRHAVLFGATMLIPDLFDVSPSLQLRSGTRYTPMVQGDVNADGLSNDRAFVFDPRATTDGELRTALSALLERAPARASRCLRAQLGLISGANSCTGPWTATTNAIFTIDPARVRLQNRGRLQLRVLNILSGVDQLVHGGDRLHGWGQSAYPDPVLLQVRGFDPVARRYQYAVNPSFGDTRAYRNVFQSPFRIAIDVALDLGPDQERVARERVLECGTSWRSCSRSNPEASGRSTRPDSATLGDRMRGAHAQFKLFDFAIRDADELKLSPAQIDTLDALGRAHNAFRDSTYDALAGFVASHGGRLDHPEVVRRWRESLRAVARFEWHVGALARALLTPAQVDAIFSRQGGRNFNYLAVRPIVLDERELERTLRLWLNWVY
ncbi:MAG: hypothetical protein ACJ79A_20305, partial [Gemmatimonadaceae bacterium]